MKIHSIYQLFFFVFLISITGNVHADYYTHYPYASFEYYPQVQFAPAHYECGYSCMSECNTCGYSNTYYQPVVYEYYHAPHYRRGVSYSESSEFAWVPPLLQ